MLEHLGYCGTFEDCVTFIGNCGSLKIVLTFGTVLPRVLLHLKGLCQREYCGIPEERVTLGSAAPTVSDRGCPKHDSTPVLDALLCVPATRERRLHTAAAVSACMNRLITHTCKILIQ